MMFKPLTISEAPAVDEAVFRLALRQFASGVTVITTRDRQGGVHGMTATAFCSLSLRPPLILVAVARETRCHTLVSSEKCFGVSILGANQAALSRHFGGKPSASARPNFDHLQGMPILSDAMVKLACTLEEAVEGGDHSIFVGLVVGAVTTPGTPLLHFDGAYRQLSADPTS